MGAVSKGERTKERKRILNNITNNFSHRCVKIDFKVTVYTVDQFSRFLFKNLFLNTKIFSPFDLDV